jgi:hypothetical protein
LSCIRPSTTTVAAAYDSSSPASGNDQALPGRLNPQRTDHGISHTFEVHLLLLHWQPSAAMHRPQTISHLDVTQRAHRPVSYGHDHDGQYFSCSGACMLIWP